MESGKDLVMIFLCQLTAGNRGKTVATHNTQTNTTQAGYTCTHTHVVGKTFIAISLKPTHHKSLNFPSPVLQDDVRMVEDF